MRRPILVVVLASAIVAVVANLGFKLAGALRQIDTFAGASIETASSAVSAEVPATLRTPLVLPAPRAEAAVEQAAATIEFAAPENEQHPRFDADAAIREAADQDSNVAELLNDSDPAVGGAVREFITHLDPPGGR